MPNMSYCRFENTANDLGDCVEAIQNGETTDLSQYEVRGLAILLEYCERIMDDKSYIESVIEQAKKDLEVRDSRLYLCDGAVANQTSNSRPMQTLAQKARRAKRMSRDEWTDIQQVKHHVSTTFLKSPRVNRVKSST